MGYETRVPVILRPFYTVYFQRYNNETWIHCDVVHWSPSARKQLSKDFEQLVHLHDDPIYAVHEIGDEKHKKFLDLFGFRFLRNIIGTDFKKRQIYIRN